MEKDDDSMITDFPLISADTRFDAVVLANGEFPVHPVPLGILRGAGHVVCCDGAVMNLPFTPTAVIGDGDSLSAEDKLRLKGLFHQVSEQEDNDLTKATRFCLGRDWRRLVYLGATGKREDHTLGNISLLVRYMREMDVLPTMVTDHGYFTPAQGRQLFRSFPGQQVSIFNYGCRTLSSEGLRWESYPYQMAWQGTLNESTGDSFTLTGDGDYLVFRTFEAKT